MVAHHLQMFPINGTCPVSISKRMTPRLYTSERALTAADCPRACSGAHVRGRALRHPLLASVRAVHETRLAEVGDEHFAVGLVVEDVRRLQVAVNDLLRVGGRQAERQLAGNGDRVARRHRRGESLEDAREGVRHDPHDDVRHAAVGPDFVNGADVGVVDLPGESGVAEERVAEVRRQLLDLRDA